MLENTLASTLVPGTNLPGEITGGAWAYLLPSLELEHVLTLGVPPLATLKTLARLAGRVSVVCSEEREARDAATIAKQAGAANAAPLMAGNPPALGLDSHSVDLVLVPRGSGRTWLGASGPLSSELQRVLKPRAPLFFDLADRRDRVLAAELDAVFTAGRKATCFRLLPIAGEVESAVPDGDRRTAAYLVRAGLAGRAIALPSFPRLERLLGGSRLLAWVGRRRGALWTGLEDAGPPPRYLRAVAEQEGVDLSDYRWGLSARGRFGSRKVLFFLFHPGATEPAYVVKLPRAAEYNARLENEHRALKLLEKSGAAVAPRAVFFGRHAGLAILGQTAITGIPFRAATFGTADCPYARAAIQSLTRLSEATADESAGGPGRAAEVLGSLLERFLEIYRLAPAQESFLRSQIAALARADRSLPVVFQHGDPGTWNLVISAEGGPVLLDWEAAEPRGMPLWDVLYFIRSYLAGTGPRWGRQRRLEHVARQLLDDSPLASLIVQAVRDYCRQVGLSARLVEPLFYTCWVHRALKEAARRPAAQLQAGHYVNLLRLAIERRSSPVLEQLFGGEAEAPVPQEAAAEVVPER